MFRNLFSHQVKRTVRHRSWDKQVATNVFLGALFILLLLNILALGFAIHDILKTFCPDLDPVVCFTGFILFYAIIDFILRLVLQEVPALSIRPYLILPIRKSRLIHYLLSKSLWSFFPVIPLLVIIPFAVKVLSGGYPMTNMILWIFGIFIFFNFITYTALYLKRKIHFNPGIIAIIIMCFILIILLERDRIISISSISTWIFMRALTNPLYNLIFVLLCIGAYSLNFLFLKKHAYAEEIIPKQGIRRGGINYGYLQRMGTFGELTALEMKLIFRNRRIRSTVYLSLWMVALAWPFYKYYYPNLDKKPLVPEYRQGEIPVAGEGTHLVEFRVVPDTPPPLRQVCITGDHPELGDWKPDMVPLQLNDDSTWSRAFVFPTGTELRYKITGSDWGNEALYADGKVPDPFNLTVHKDTTITIQVHAWNEDRVFSIISGSMLIYIGVFFTGMFIMTYGQFLFAWEAGYFDLILAKKIDYRKYLNVKVFLLASTCVAVYLFIAPFLFRNTYAFNSVTVALMYNLGINLPLMAFLALFNRTRIDISAGAFSMQGKGGQQMLNALILILSPAFISGFLIKYYGIKICFWVMGGIGLSGIIMLPFTLHLITKKFIRIKYIMGAAFREPI
jgi:hypothetical protein